MIENVKNLANPHNHPVLPVKPLLVASNTPNDHHHLIIPNQSLIIIMLVLANILVYSLPRQSHPALPRTPHSLILLAVVELYSAAIIGLGVGVRMREGDGTALKGRVGRILTQ